MMYKMAERLAAIPEQEAWLYRNNDALSLVQKGLEQARAGRFSETPPDLDADAALVQAMSMVASPELNFLE